MDTNNGSASLRRSPEPESSREDFGAAESIRNEEARDAEYVRLHEELVRAVRRVCPPWLASHSDDLVQVGLLRVMEIQRKRSGHRELSKSYMWMVAHSAVVDEIRRHRRRREVPLETSEHADVIPSLRPDPETRLSGREVDEAIRKCAAGLIESRRVAVLLHIHGHTLSEVADRMDWNFKRAKNLVYRGLSDLRECLAAKGFRREHR